MKNSCHSVSVEGYSSEGLGIAHVDGRVIFIHGAVRGERCRIQILKVLKNCAFAKVLQVEEVSPQRQEPACPYFTRCGGCDFWHISYEEELSAKRQRVDDALRRIGGLSLQTEAIHGAREICFYRNKSQYPVSAEGQVGFYRARSHQVIPVERCLIQKPEADAARAAVAQWMQRFGVSGYDEKTGKGLLRHIYVRSNRRGESLICLLVNAERLPHEEELVQQLRAACPGAVGVVLGINRRRDNVILGDSYRCLWGSDRLEDTLCGLRFSLSVPSFYQVNRDQAERLYELAVEMAGLTGEETVLDLYCGTGTITLAMARQAARAIGAEIVPQAIEDAKENARRNAMADKTEFYCADAAQIAGELARQQLQPDVICVDPPRKGLAPEVIGHVCAMQPRRVVYVSCDPATLARDLKLFAEKGYEAVRAAAVDMFPRTVHVESVVLLERSAVTHEMKLHAQPFAQIQSGQKTIELRLFDEKRQKLRVGDSIVFTDSASGQRLKTRVEKLHRFPDFRQLYQALPLLQCGYTQQELAVAQPSDMEQYYSAQEQAQYGVVGIEISLSE